MRIKIEFIVKNEVQPNYIDDIKKKTCKYTGLFYSKMVGTEGLEPSRAQCPTVLSPLRLPIPPRSHLEVPIGFEPMITELQSIALASWLRNQFLNAYS